MNVSRFSAGEVHEVRDMAIARKSTAAWCGLLFIIDFLPYGIVGF